MKNLKKFLILAAIGFAFSSITVEAKVTNTVVDQLIETTTDKSINHIVESVSEAQKSRSQNQNCDKHYPLGMPVITSIDKDKVYRRSFYLCESNFAVQYDPATKNPIWVSEVLKGQEQKNTFIKRIDNFQPNPNVPIKAQAKLNDYKNSGFDRGHMAPAANMLTEKAMEESFYLTNMVPQVGPNMNRGIWAELEEEVRQWSVKRNEIIVISGPLFLDKEIYKIGTSNVFVPSHIYKVIVDPKKNESVAFIFPNKQIITRKTKKLDAGNLSQPYTLPENAINCSSTCSIYNFQISIEDLEKYANISFIPKINNNNIKKMKIKF